MADKIQDGEKNIWGAMSVEARTTMVDLLTVDQIWEMQKVGGEMSFPKTQLEEDYNAIKLSPRFVPEKYRGKVGGKYEPKVFTMQAQTFTVADAVTEILDGIIENHQSLEDKDKVTTVEFIIQHQTSSDPQILIKEDSGGIRYKSLNSIVNIGNSNWGKLYGVGVFGEGLKKALRSLGESTEIFTCHLEEDQGSQLELSEEYWASIGSAKTDVYEYPDGEKGTTQIVIKSLTPLGRGLAERGFPDWLVKYLGLIYGNWLRRVDGTIEISFKNPGEEAKFLVPKAWLDSAVYKAKYSKFPGFEPKTLTFTIPSEVQLVGKPPTVKMTFGLTLSGDDKYCGVTVSGNNRIFKIGDTSPYWGFGQESDFGRIKRIGGSFPARFHCFIEIEAEKPIDIPWEPGKKIGYNHVHEIHKYLLNAVQCVAKPYMDFDAVAKDKDINRFYFTEDTKVVIPRIPLSKVKNGESHKHWHPPEMETMRKSLQNVIKSKDEEILSDFYQKLGAEKPPKGLDTLFKGDSKMQGEIEEFQPPQNLHIKDAVELIDEYENMKREDQKSMPFAGSFRPKILKLVLEKSGLLENEKLVYPQDHQRAGKAKAARIMEELFFHFMETKHMYKPENFPGEYRTFDEWAESLEPEKPWFSSS